MKLSSGAFNEVMKNIPGYDDDKMRLEARKNQVQDMWRALVEEIILDHTNAVYIIRQEDGKFLHVYVDDSLFSAELNARRELIKLQLHIRFNEDVDGFIIHISRGNMRHRYPFKEEEKQSRGTVNLLPLGEEYLKQVEEVCALIPDENARMHFKRAMIADLQRKNADSAI